MGPTVYRGNAITFDRRLQIRNRLARMKEKSVENQNSQGKSGEMFIYMIYYNEIYENSHFILLFSTWKIFNRGSNPACAMAKRLHSPRFTATMKNPHEKRPRFAAAHSSNWKVTVTWFPVLHFFAPIFTTSGQIAIGIGVDSLSHHTSWVCKRNFWFWTSRHEVVPNLHESWSLVYGAPLKWTCSTMVSTLGPHLQGHHPPPTFKGFITGPYLIGFETSGVSSVLPCGELGSEVCKLVVTSFTHSGPNDYNRRCSVIYISNKSDSRHYITFGLQSCHLSREKTGFERLEVGRSVGFPECMPWHFRTWNFWSSGPIAVENSAKWSSENRDGGYDKGSWPFDALVKWEEWKWEGSQSENGWVQW